MTNEAIAAILEHLCNEARNAVHAAFGVRDLLCDAALDSARQASRAIGTASADQLLRSLDDVRDLVSSAPPAPVTLEEFDLTLCISEIVEALNLASGRRTRHMVLEGPSDPLPITQDRKALEQVVMRVLDTAFKLAQTSEVRVKLSPRPGKGGGRLLVEARDADVAARLTKWLNSNPDQAVLQDPCDVPFAVAVMVAGKRLRALQGSAELVRDSAGHSSVAFDLPEQARIDGEDRPPSGQETQLGTLNVLVAEDSDDSFMLTEVMLEDENVSRARDGLQALHMIQKRRFDVVFMDVHMTGMDGYSAIRSIRDWETQTGNARTPLVVLSSDDLETQHKSAAQSGCSGFLRKPLRRSDLINLVERLKQSRKLVA